MNAAETLGKFLVGMGLLLVIFGLIVLAMGKLGGIWKPLPGDIVVRRGNFTFYAPIATSLLLSLFLSALLTFLAWLLSGRR
ncbi:MAG: hypothetical protein OXFUSZZB_002338 [Candidatus Fervidibacter sp.]|jgi:hypothetical protein